MLACQVCQRSRAVHVQERTAAALSVALQHPAISFDPNNICKLLQTCKSWKAAVQQSSAGLTEINLSCDFQSVERPLQVMTSLSAWLPKCLGLVRRLNISTTRNSTWDPNAESAAVLAAAEALLAFSLQAEVHQLLQGGATAAAAMGVHLEPQLRRRLQLQQYSSNTLTSLRVISALPAATLTRLALSELDSSSALTALSRFTALQQLDLECNAAFEIELPNISMMQCLTELRLDQFDLSSGLAQLPRQLQQLTVFSLIGGYVADLQYLQQLQRLHFDTSNVASEQWIFPAQLQQLTILGMGHAKRLLECYHVSYLHHLKQLQIVNSADSAEQLLLAAQMSELQHMSLTVKYRREECLHNGVAQAWCRIPQLRKLDIDLGGRIDMENLLQLARHVAAISQLRELRIQAVITSQVPGAQEDANEGLCKVLSSMMSLQDLQLEVQHSTATSTQDTLQLTALTGLSRLELHGLQLDAAIATCLAIELTNLQRLSFVRPQVDWCVASLPAINKLTRLTYLRCNTFSDAQARRGLSFLTGLTSLAALHGFEIAGKAAITEFWAALQHPLM